MSGNATRINWPVILTILLLIGMVIGGPLLMGQIGPEAAAIEIKLPLAVNGANSLALTSLQAIGVLLAAAVIAVIVAGAFLSFILARLERETAVVKSSENFQANQSALDQRASEKINQMRQGRQTAGAPAHHTPRWNAFSTSLILILFAIFFGMLLNSALAPEGELLVNGRTASAITTGLIWLTAISLFIIIWRMYAPKAQASKSSPASWDIIWVAATGLLVVGISMSLIVYVSGDPEVEIVINSAVPIVDGLALISLFILAWRIHPQKLTALNQTDHNPIPWDFIWVLITGLLVVGLGTAFVIYFNTPG